jgi:hypothetical protein
MVNLRLKKCTAAEIVALDQLEYAVGDLDLEQRLDPRFVVGGLRRRTVSISLNSNL